MFFERATSGLHDLPRYLITIVAIFFAYGLIGIIPLWAVQYYKISVDGSIGTEELNEFNETMNFSVLGISNNLGLFLMLMVFVSTLLALMLCAKYVHKIPFQRLITPLEKINWKKIFFGFSFWMALAVIMELIFYFLSPDSYIFEFKPVSFLILLVISLVLLPLQTSTEELVFRGYLMPWIGRLVGNKWIPLLVTSILFGLVHSANPEVEKFGFWNMQIYYVSAGLLLGLVTILDDSLELALGIHAGTNILSATLLSFEGSVIQTDTLFKTTTVNTTYMTIGLYIAGAIFIFICSKKYNWNGLDNLMKKVSPFDSSNALDKSL